MAKFNGQLLPLGAMEIIPKFVATLNFGRIMAGHRLNINSIGSVASG
jgi:hypothetical protein